MKEEKMNMQDAGMPENIAKVFNMVAGYNHEQVMYTVASLVIVNGIDPLELADVVVGTLADMSPEVRQLVEIAQMMKRFIG